MTSVDTLFTRSLLKLGATQVKKHFPKIRIVKDAWVYHSGRGCWEFHGPKTGNADMPQFYWYGRAHDAYEARYKGWMAWLRSAAAAKGIDIDAEDES